MNAPDWAQLAIAIFTAIAAGTALATVIRAEGDRRDRALPDFHIELIHDVPNDQARAYVVNYGGPAREVRVMGVDKTFGFYGLIGPTSYWRPGESRMIELAMPVASDRRTINVLVLTRDVRMRSVFATTTGGAQHKWPIGDDHPEVSDEKVWKDVFGDAPGPLEVEHTPVNMETIERAW